MKYLLKTGTLLFGLLSVTQWACKQDQTAQSNKTVTMEVINEQIANKEAIRNLYEVILNERKLDLLDELVSVDYTNDQGGRGVEGFKAGITSVISAFPDVQWEVEELISERNKVMIKQAVKGIHKGDFQQIKPTGKAIYNHGFAIYTFENGKIVHHQIMTDRLSFLQQLEVLPADISSLAEKSDDHVIFVDRFVIPRSAYAEFMKKVAYNRNYIRTLPGFIKDEMMIQQEEVDHIGLMTVAVWQSQSHLDAAKKSVQEEYARIQFNPAEFTKEHGIKMDRQLYKAIR